MIHFFNSPKLIRSKEDLEAAALKYGILPFFSNSIRGFSVHELAAPGMLFGETNQDEGCWEWKGPVIREKTTAYGKFYNRKAGFISLPLLPHFLNYRRNAYPVKEGSTEEMILEIIRENDGISSTELKRWIHGPLNSDRTAEDLVTLSPSGSYKRKSIEGPLQRLQMGGHLLISNFEYKYTRRGERYGWGVAVYSTPELWFGRSFDTPGVSPEKSFEILTGHVKSLFPKVPDKIIANLLK